jgi:hypothetical protein
MRSEPLKLRILTPAQGPVPGRGFYQLDEDSLYVPVGPPEQHRRFFSFLESEQVRLDMDKDGRLLFIEVSSGRHTWTVVDELPLPTDTPPADVRWLDYRSSIPNPRLLCDQSRQTLLIKFSDALPSRHVLLAESVILTSDRQDHLVSILVTDIVDDVAGRSIARFGKEHRVEPMSEVSPGPETPISSDLLRKTRYGRRTKRRSWRIDRG